MLIYWLLRNTATCKCQAYVDCNDNSTPKRSIARTVKCTPVYARVHAYTPIHTCPHTHRLQGSLWGQVKECQEISLICRTLGKVISQE